MLGYSASGSMIDYFNTADGVNGTGFATELTVGTEVNWLTYPALLNQVWVDSTRFIRTNTPTASNANVRTTGAL